MRSRAWFVILSLAACRGADAPPASPPIEDTNVAPHPAPSGSEEVGGGPGASADASREDSPGQEPRRRIRISEHRGPATSNILYRVIEPDDASATTPIVIALHGRGDNAAGFVGLARRLELDARVIVTEGPLHFGNIGGRQWFDSGVPDVAAQIRARLDALDILRADLANRYPEAGKPGLVGFSQGAMLGLVIASERPDRFRAIAALSGRLVEGVQGVQSPPDASPTVLVVAGTKDGIIPQEASWAAANALEALGREVERFSFQGPHTIPPSVLDEVARFFDRELAPQKQSP